MPAGYPVKVNYLTGDVLTAANLNDLAGTVNLYDPTAKGDLFPASAADTVSRLAVGANDTVLTADSTTATGMKWAAAAGGAAFSGASIYAYNDISITNDTYTTITWNSEWFDTDSYHNTSTNTSRITIPSGKTGKFLIHASAMFQTNATGLREFQLFKNGTLFVNTFHQATANNHCYMQFTRLISASATDYYEVKVRQDSGGNLSIHGTSSIVGSNEFSIVYLGA